MLLADTNPEPRLTALFHEHRSTMEPAMSLNQALALEAANGMRQGFAPFLRQFFSAIDAVDTLRLVRHFALDSRKPLFDREVFVFLNPVDIVHFRSSDEFLIGCEASVRIRFMSTPREAFIPSPILSGI